MTWRIWVAVGFVIVAGVSDTVSYYAISVPGAVEDVAAWIRFVMGPGILAPGVIAVAFAIDRRWVFLLPIATIPVQPILEHAGFYPRYGDSFSILTLDGLAFYAIISLVLWEVNLFLGLTLRVWWERRPPRWKIQS